MISLDHSKLLGFKLVGTQRSGAKIGSKVGLKPGRAKFGAKIGGKVSSN